jgi:NADPH2 dehydrogenase
MKMPNPRQTFAYLATALRDKYPNIAYLQVTESLTAGNINVPDNGDEVNDFLREIWNRKGGEKRIFISARQHSAEYN